MPNCQVLGSPLLLKHSGPVFQWPYLNSGSDVHLPFYHNMIILNIIVNTRRTCHNDTNSKHWRKKAAKKERLVINYLTTAIPVVHRNSD